MVQGIAVLNFGSAEQTVYNGIWVGPKSWHPKIITSLCREEPEICPVLLTVCSRGGRGPFASVW